MEYIDVKVDEEPPNKNKRTCFINPLDHHHHISKENEVQYEGLEDAKTYSKGPSRHTQRNHLENQIIGDKSEGVQTRRQLVEKSKKVHIAMLSQIEPKNFEEASKDKIWIDVINKELDQIEKKRTWELTPRPAGKNFIGTKRVFKNKMNEQDQVVRNKARLVCKG